MCNLSLERRDIPFTKQASKPAACKQASTIILGSKFVLLEWTFIHYDSLLAAAYIVAGNNSRMFHRPENSDRDETRHAFPFIV